MAVHNRDIVEVSGPYDSWETAVKNIGRAKFIYNQNQIDTLKALQNKLKPILGDYYVSAYYVDSSIYTYENGTIEIKPTINDAGKTQYFVEYKAQERYIDSNYWNPFVEKIVTVADPIIFL